MIEEEYEEEEEEQSSHLGYQLIRKIPKIKMSQCSCQTHFLDAVHEKLVTAPFVAETTCRDPAAPQSRVELQFLFL